MTNPPHSEDERGSAHSTLQGVTIRIMVNAHLRRGRVHYINDEGHNDRHIRELEYANWPISEDDLRELTTV